MSLFVKQSWLQMFLHAIFKLTIVFVDQYSTYKHYKPTTELFHVFQRKQQRNSCAYEARKKNINKLNCGLKSIKLQQWKLIVINHEKEIYDFDDDVLLPILSRVLWAV